MTVNLTLDNYHHHRTESTIISLPEGTTYYYFDSKWKTLRLRLIQFCWPILVKLTLAPGFALRSMSKIAIPTCSLAEDSIDVIDKLTVSTDSARLQSSARIDRHIITRSVMTQESIPKCARSLSSFNAISLFYPEQRAGCLNILSSALAFCKRLISIVMIPKEIGIN